MGSVMAQAPDPCALLTTDEIQPLAVKEQIGNGVPSAIQPEGRATVDTGGARGPDATLST
jgi:hypothetical protein